MKNNNTPPHYPYISTTPHQNFSHSDFIPYYPPSTRPAHSVGAICQAVSHMPYWSVSMRWAFALRHQMWQVYQDADSALGEFIKSSPPKVAIRVMTGLQLLNSPEANASLLKVAGVNAMQELCRTGLVGAPCWRVQGGKAALVCLKAVNLCELASAVRVTLSGRRACRAFPLSRILAFKKSLFSFFHIVLLAKAHKTIWSKGFALKHGWGPRTTRG